jgi:hypothetical protein
LDVLIGLITIYLTLGLAVTAVVEALAAWLSVRSSNLEAALKEFFDGTLGADQEFVKAFYEHPLVRSLSKGRDGKPSYIPAEIVGQVVEALVTANGTVTSIKQAVKNLPGTAETNRVKGLLEALIRQAGGDAAAFRTAVEAQFNAVMDRASGWFKRRQQTVALLVSALIVCGGNVDTLSLATALASSPEARARLVEIAAERLERAKAVEGQAEKGDPASGVTLDQARKLSAEALDRLETAKADLLSAGFGFGWQGQGADLKTIGKVLAKAVGLLVSLLAVSLGAPFWFDMLQRFMQVRAAGSRGGGGEKK